MSGELAEPRHETIMQLGRVLWRFANFTTVEHHLYKYVPHTEE